MDATRRQWLKTCTAAGLSMSPICMNTSHARVPNKAQRLHGQAFGTRWSLVTSASHSAADLLSLVKGAISTVDNDMSPYKAQSLISQINQSNSSGWHSLSIHSKRVLEASLYLAEQTDGVFDPTVGPLVNRFGFGPIVGDTTPDFRALTVNGMLLRKHRNGITLDLCAVAKGYAIDLISDALHAFGVTDFLIECGGELRSSGVHSSGRAWHVGIEVPTFGTNTLHTVVRIENQALATSGVHHNAYQLNDKNYTHLIDSHSQRPISDDLLSVSVFCENAMLADGWATALLLCGKKLGPALAVENNISALFLYREADSIKEVSTVDFSKFRLESA